MRVRWVAPVTAVYYVCPNCGNKSDVYDASMVHYYSCDVVKPRTASSASTPGSPRSSNTPPPNNLGTEPSAEVAGSSDKTKPGA